MTTINNRSISKVFLLVCCRLILPLSSIFLLIILPFYLHRHYFLDSTVIDLVTRIFLTIYFCMSYWSLPTFYSRKKVAHTFGLNFFSSANSTSLKLFYVANILLYGFFISLITWFSIIVFVPYLNKFQYAISTINGLIFISILITQYGDFKSRVGER
jgi:hypothetical protein